MPKAFYDLPDFEAGCRMPSGQAISMSDKAARAAAQWGSARLLDAISLYCERYHPASIEAAE